MKTTRPVLNVVQAVLAFAIFEGIVLTALLVLLGAL